MRFRVLWVSFILGCSRDERSQAASTVGGPDALDAALPVAAVEDDAAQTTLLPELDVRLLADGGTWVGERAAANDQDVERFTRESVATTGGLPVVIRAEPSVPYARTIHVLDTIKRAGATRVSFASPASTFPALMTGTSVPVVAPSSRVVTVLVVTLPEAGTAAVNGTRVANDDAIASVAAIERRKNPDVTARIEADGRVPQGRIVHVLDKLHAAGIERISFTLTPRDTVPKP